MQAARINNNKRALYTKVPFFYGWIIIAVLIITGFLMMGINSSFGVFFNSLVDEFNMTRATTSSVLSVRMLFSMGAVLLTGWGIDKFGPRIVFSVMGFFVGLSLVVTSFTTNGWQLFITYGLLMSLGTGAVYVVITTTILRWFNRKRGIAIGISGIGGGIGTAVLSPLSASLIENFAWRDTMLLMGIVAWILLLPSAQLLINSPENIGTYPDGEGNVDEVPVQGTADTSQAESLHQIFLRINFWVIFLIWLFMAFSQFFIMTHIVPHAIDIGFSEIESATILSLTGIAMILGRLGAGILSDRLNIQLIAILSSIIQLASILSLLWIQDIGLLYLFGIIYGFTFGSFGASITVMIGRAFSLNNIGKILGLLEVGIFIGGAIGPYLGGLLYDINGSYNTAFIVMSGAIIIRMVLVLFVRLNQKPVTNY